jgi:hypothetical protein
MSEVELSSQEELSTRDGYGRWAEIYDVEDNPLIVLEERDLAGLAVAMLASFGLALFLGLQASTSGAWCPAGSRVALHPLLGWPGGSGGHGRVDL